MNMDSITGSNESHSTSEDLNKLKTKHPTSVTNSSTAELMAYLDRDQSIEVDWFFQPKNPAIRRDYIEYISGNRSFEADLLLIFCMFLYDYAVVISPKLSHTTIVRNLQYSMWPLLVIKLIAALANISELYLRRFNYMNIILQTIQRHKLSFNAIYILAWTVQTCLVVFAIALSEPCVVKDAPLFTTVYCKLPIQVNDIPPAACLLLAMVPLVSITCLREVRAWVYFTSWLLVSGTFIGVLILIESPSPISKNFATIFFVISIIMMNDIMRQNFSKFKITHFLRETMAENDRLRVQERATEMRHLIANVAHDLKTPLSSFMMGVDLIQGILKDISSQVVLHEKNLPSATLSIFASFQNAFESVNACLEDIHNTNSFMLMTINRCLDYAKASKGLKLVPKNETIHLSETLRLPLTCMQNVRQEMKIQMSPIPREICSHIITDKQWLQENILCLLSNAVKYSPTGGLVTIDVSLTDKPRAHAEKTVSVSESRSLKAGYTSSGKGIFPEEKNAPSVVYSCQDEIAAEKEIRFDVEDTGIGVSEEVMADLFNPFKQAQRMAGGTGLGLFSMAKRIEALGGSYNVCKRRDGQQGTLFWFTIPYRPDSTVVDNARFLGIEAGSDPMRLEDIPASFPGSGNFLSPRVSTPLSAAETATPVAAPAVIAAAEGVPKCACADDSTAQGDQLGYHILLAEDSLAMQKLMKMMLKRGHHLVKVANNGAEALRMVEESRESTSDRDKYDVVLMDLQMPVMDGLESIKRIRALEKKRKTPRKQFIIGLSANSDRETMEEAFVSGVDAFMEKPFKIEVFNNYMNQRNSISVSK